MKAAGIFKCVSDFVKNSNNTSGGSADDDDETFKANNRARFPWLLTWIWVGTRTYTEIRLNPANTPSQG